MLQGCLNRYWGPTVGLNFQKGTKCLRDSCPAGLFAVINNTRKYMYFYAVCVCVCVYVRVRACAHVCGVGIDKPLTLGGYFGFLYWL